MVNRAEHPQPALFWAEVFASQPSCSSDSVAQLQPLPQASEPPCLGLQPKDTCSLMVCAYLSPAKTQLAETGVNGISSVPWVGAASPARLCSSSSAPSHGRKERMKGKVRSYLAMRL